MPPNDSVTGFRFRVFLAIALTAALFLLISLYGHQASTAIVLQTLEKSASAITAETSTAVEVFLRGAEIFPRTLAETIEKGDIRQDELLSLLRSYVKGEHSIYGAGVAFEPFAYDPRRRDYNPYFHEVPSGVTLKWLGGDYDYRAKEWYRLAKEGGKPAWTEPYLDVGAGDVMMCSFVVPMYRTEKGKRIFRGVVSADISLAWLNMALSKAGALPSSYGVIVSRSGRLIVHPIRELVLKKTIFDLERLASDKGYGELGRRMLRGERGFVRLKSYVTGKPSWIYFSPIGSTGWSVALATPEEDLLSSIRELNHRLVAFGGLTVLFLAAILFVVSRSVTKPLALLSAATLKIAEGNLDEPLPATGGPSEVLMLRRSLEKMRRDLKEEMAALAAATVREERIDSELRIARKIQASFLPRTFPERGDVDVYALLDPAREVGGDLYDFFLLDEDRVFFAIGDVSDKGVPAALFMAATVTTVRALAQRGLPPGEILTRANRELCRENDELMFVTMLCGILDLRDGRLILSNAGHLSPVLRPTDAPPAVIEVEPGLVLGVRENFVYADENVDLPPGAVLLLFTDGITDLGKEDGGFLGMEGVLSAVAESTGTAPESVVRRLTDQVRLTGVPQPDDIAVLALRYKGRA
jgi:phosphoserine phosphatase RsbU/P